MGIYLTEDEYRAPGGRRLAWRSLMLGDHGFLRKVYDNSHQISDEAWRSYQPSPLHIRKWAERGIRTVINLRGLRNNVRQPGFYWLEKDACAEAGIDFIDHRAYSREAPKPEFITELDEIFRTARYPIMMHCKSGADRAGIGSTLYKFLREGTSLDEAQEQLSFRYGHVKSGKTGVLDHFFAAYREAAARDGVTPNREHFLDWVRTDYDRDAVTGSFTPAPLGNLLTEVILRRE